MLDRPAGPSCRQPTNVVREAPARNLVDHHIRAARLDRRQPAGVPEVSTWSTRSEASMNDVDSDQHRHTLNRRGGPPDRDHSRPWAIHSVYYERGSEFAIGAALLLAARVPNRHRPLLVRATTGAAAVWLAMAGVVAAASFTEAVSLVTGAVFLGVCSQFARPPRVAG